MRIENFFIFGVWLDYYEVLAFVFEDNLCTTSAVSVSTCFGSTEELTVGIRNRYLDLSPRTRVQILRHDSLSLGGISGVQESSL